MKIRILQQGELTKTDLFLLGICAGVVLMSILGWLLFRDLPEPTEAEAESQQKPVDVNIDGFAIEGIDFDVGFDSVWVTTSKDGCLLLISLPLDDYWQVEFERLRGEVIEYMKEN